MARIETEKEILDLIRTDSWMIKVLATVAELNLPDWWIGAGFVRNKVWDTIFDLEKRTPLGDIDVIFFEPHNLSEYREKDLEASLTKKLPGEKWSVTNQARMHLENNDAPYTSSIDAIAVWPETATSLAVHISDGRLELLEPHGIGDLVAGIVRPTPCFKRKKELYRVRQARKNWQVKWPRLKFIPLQ
jgi:hypothetical protein